jgi:hypothetical protein
MTLDILCEEFRVADEIKLQKKQQKRSKRKARRQIKTNEINEVCLNMFCFLIKLISFSKEKSNKIIKNIDENKILWTNNKQEEILIRRRTSSCCSCLCHFCDERSNSLSIIHTTIPSISLVKSQSCPSSLLFASESITKPSVEKTIPISSSLETLFSSISTRECVCHERNLGKRKLVFI